VYSASRRVEEITMHAIEEVIAATRRLSHRERRATARLLAARANPRTEYGAWKTALGAALVATIAIERGEPIREPHPIDELRASTARLSPATREEIATAFADRADLSTNVGRWFARVGECLAGPRRVANDDQ
jgi:hypothetical protein